LVATADIFEKCCKRNYLALMLGNSDSTWLLGQLTCCKNKTGSDLPSTKLIYDVFFQVLQQNKSIEKTPNTLKIRQSLFFKVELARLQLHLKLRFQIATVK